MKTVTYKNTFPDILAYMRHHYFRMPMMYVVLAFFVYSTSISTWSAIPATGSAGERIFTFVIIETVILAVLILATFLFSALSMLSRRNKTIFTEHTISLLPEALVEETQYSRSEFKWSSVQKIAKSRRYIFVYMSQHQAHVIPRRAFQSDADWNSFYGELTEYVERDHPSRRCS